MISTKRSHLCQGQPLVLEGTQLRLAKHLLCPGVGVVNSAPCVCPLVDFPSDREARKSPVGEEGRMEEKRPLEKSEC